MADITELTLPIVTDGEVINDKHFKVLAEKLNEVIRKVNNTITSWEKTFTINTATGSSSETLEVDIKTGEYFDVWMETASAGAVAMMDKSVSPAAAIIGEAYAGWNTFKAGQDINTIGLYFTKATQGETVIVKIRKNRGNEMHWYRQVTGGYHNPANGAISCELVNGDVLSVSYEAEQNSAVKIYNNSLETPASLGDVAKNAVTTIPITTSINKLGIYVASGVTTAYLIKVTISK